MLQEVVVNVDSNLQALADGATTALRKKDEEGNDLSEEAVKSSVRLAVFSQTDRADSVRVQEELTQGLFDVIE